MQLQKMVQITVAEGRTIQSGDVLSRNPVTGDISEFAQRIYKPGETLEVTAREAERLRESGHAVRPDAKPQRAQRTLVA